MRITNVVVQGDLGCTFDLKELTNQLTNVRYDPKSFSGVIWQHKKIGGNCLIFSNGKINTNGKCSTFREGTQRLRRYARLLQRMGYAIRLNRVRLITASACHRLSGKINPASFSEGYEPELFPALMFKRDGLHFTCHLSGTLIITGIKGKKDLDNAYPVILELELYT